MKVIAFMCVNHPTRQNLEGNQTNVGDTTETDAKPWHNSKIGMRMILQSGLLLQRNVTVALTGLVWEIVGAVKFDKAYQERYPNLN